MPLPIRIKKALQKFLRRRPPLKKRVVIEERNDGLNYISLAPKVKP